MNEMLREAPRPARVAQTIDALAAAFGDRLVTSLAVREQHANTTWVAGTPADAVLFARTTHEVQRAVRICAGHGVPVIPFGAGTSFEGHVNAPFGGICFDMKDMIRGLAVHAQDFDRTVEPGVTRQALNDHESRQDHLMTQRGRL